MAMLAATVDFSGRDPLVEFAKENIRYHSLHFEAGKSA